MENLTKDIEKRIEKVANGSHTFNPELPNGWRLDLCSYEIDDTTYVDVMIIPDPGKDDKLYYTVKAGDQDSVSKAAEGAAKVVTLYKTKEDKGLLVMAAKMRK